MSSTAGAVRGQTGLRNWAALASLALLALLANAYWGGVLNERERVAIAKVTGVQVLSQQIAKFANEAAAGQLEAFDELKSTRNAIEKNVTELRRGSPDGSSPAYEGDTIVGRPLADLVQAWEPVRTAADTIVERQELVLNMTETANDFNSKLPQINQRMEEISRMLQERDAPGSQVYMTTRQMLLVDRMARRVSDILKGGAVAFSAADQFGRDAKMYGSVLDGLLNGSTELNIRP